MTIVDAGPWLKRPSKAFPGKPEKKMTAAEAKEMSFNVFRERGSSISRTCYERLVEANSFHTTLLARGN